MKSKTNADNITYPGKEFARRASLLGLFSLSPFQNISFSFLLPFSEKTEIDAHLLLLTMIETEFMPKFSETRLVTLGSYVNDKLSD